MGKANLWATTARAKAIAAVGGASLETSAIATVNDADEFVMPTAFAFVGIAGR